MGLGVLRWPPSLTHPHPICKAPKQAGGGVGTAGLNSPSESVSAAKVACGVEQFVCLPGLLEPARSEAARRHHHTCAAAQLRGGGRHGLLVAHHSRAIGSTCSMRDGMVCPSSGQRPHSGGGWGGGASGEVADRLPNHVRGTISGIAAA